MEILQPLNTNAQLVRRSDKLYNQNFGNPRPVENGVSPLLLSCWRVDPAPSGESGDDLDLKSVIRLAMWAVVLRRIVSNGPRKLHYVVSSALQINSITVPLTLPRHSQHYRQKVVKISVPSLVPPIYSFHPLYAQIFRRKSDMFQIMYVFLPRAKIIRLAFSQTFSTWWVKEFIVDVNPQGRTVIHVLHIAVEGLLEVCSVICLDHNHNVIRVRDHLHSISWWERKGPYRLDEPSMVARGIFQQNLEHSFFPAPREVGNSEAGVIHMENKLRDKGVQELDDHPFKLVCSRRFMVFQAKDYLAEFLLCYLSHSGGVFGGACIKVLSPHFHLHISCTGVSFC
ncbi:hypothetical protein GEV33_003992 [Tenebrio molitor]|uniref:Uncharacterized protein n=1 Tax=Tenebrio molitor TaxID=7067 RepID=A0A8J6LGS7_TENMO|nr:hypothetical protein GEV33_003992 [Tenebrio molitor]